jgi:hypothetical protein
VRVGMGGNGWGRGPEGGSGWGGGGDWGVEMLSTTLL